MSKESIILEKVSKLKEDLNVLNTKDSSDIVRLANEKIEELFNLLIKDKRIYRW